MHGPLCAPAWLQLTKEGSLKLNATRFFVLDECDKMLEKLGGWHRAPGTWGVCGSARAFLCVFVLFEGGVFLKGA